MEHGKSIKVVVAKQDESLAMAQAREHKIFLNIKKGSGEAGFTATETLLSALGTCLMTNINGIGEKMHLKMDDVRIEFSAIRTDEPPIITEITYKLFIKTNESAEKLTELYEVSKKWGTVTNTLIGGLTPNGEMIIEK